MIRSDSLPALVSLLELLPDEVRRLMSMAAVPLLIGRRVIVDTNFVFNTALAHIFAIDPDARTAFEEAVAAGVLQAFAPPWLLEELRAKTQEVAERRKVALGELDRWVKVVLKSITIVEPPDRDSISIAMLSTRDVKDVPFAQLYECLSADAILSGDRHFDGLGYRRIDDFPSFTVPLRDYARNRAQELGPAVGGLAAATATAALASGVVSLLRRAPWWVNMVLGGLVVSALFSESVRGRIGDQIGRFIESIGPAVEELRKEHRAAQLAAPTLEAQVGALVRSPSDRRTLLAHVVDALAGLREGASEQAIIASAIESGYRGRPSPSYLRRILRTNRSFVFVAGCWRLKASEEWPSSSAHDASQNA